METLTPAERELVALGAALGSNCVPCIEYHVPEARKTGLSDGQISEALRLADRVRQVPARKVLAAAVGAMGAAPAASDQAPGESACAQPTLADVGTEQACCS